MSPGRKRVSQGHSQGRRETDHVRLGHRDRGATPPLPSANEQDQYGRTRQPKRQAAPPRTRDPGDRSKQMNHQDKGGALQQEPAHDSCPVFSSAAGTEHSSERAAEASQEAHRPPARSLGCWLTATL